ncbi:hypothetical protein ME808_17670 [Lactobacillus delbrueckii]|nr:hypothetical protein ME808_17670 [Lactobacillus delbrueckii]
MFNDQIKQFEVSGMSYKHLTIKEREILIFLRAKGVIYPGCCITAGAKSKDYFTGVKTLCR